MVLSSSTTLKNFTTKVVLFTNIQSHTILSKTDAQKDSMVHQSHLGTPYLPTLSSTINSGKTPQQQQTTSTIGYHTKESITRYHTKFSQATRQNTIDSKYLAARSTTTSQNNLEKNLKTHHTQEYFSDMMKRTPRHIKFLTQHPTNQYYQGQQYFSKMNLEIPTPLLHYLNF